LRAPSGHVWTRRQIVAAAAAIAAVVAGVLTATLPSMSLQVAAALACATSLAAFVAARLGWVLNPAWIVIFALYLAGPVGTLVQGAGLGLSVVAMLAIGPIPFVLAALAIRPDVRDRILLVLPLAILVAFGGLSLLWSTNPEHGLAKLTIWTLTGLLPATFIVVLAPASPRFLWGALAVAALAYAVGLIAFGEASALYPGRLALFGDNPIWTARAAFIGALVAVFGPFPRIAKVIMTPVLIAAGLLTVSLGPLLGFLAGGWVGSAAMIRAADRASDRARLGWIALGLSSGAVLVVLLADAMFGGAGSIIAKVVVNDPNVTGRATFLDAASRLFLAAPLIGTGLGGFLATGLAEYPHNVVAEIGAELGAFGLLALAAWFGLALRGAGRSPIIMALLVATAVFSLFSGSVASNAEFWMFSALAVAGLSRQHAAVKRGSPDPVPHAAGASPVPQTTLGSGY